MSKRPFKLKSGNSPIFKQVGSSPANINNFGIGPGGSPWKQGETETDAQKLARLEKEKAQVIEGKKVQPGKGTKAGDIKEPAWKKGLKLGVDMLSGGLQAVYGGVRTHNPIAWGRWKQEELDKSAGEKYLDEMKTPKTNGSSNEKDEKKKNGSTYKVVSGDSLSKIAKDNNTTVEELMKKNPEIKHRDRIFKGQNINLP